jgi:bla regulator protein blaR1
MTSDIVVTIVGALIVGSLDAQALHAQSTSVNSTFDVASVRLNKSGDGATTLGFQQGGRFKAVNETVWRLIGEAYAMPQQLPRFRIIGGPQWIDADRFDVEAVTQQTTTTEQGRLMLRSLLTERFKLAVHTETRDLPVFSLVKVRTEGPLGPQLHASAVDCATLGSKPPPTTSGQARPCVLRFGLGQLSAEGMTASQLAAGLSRYVNRVVVDRSGLAGGFDWDLHWTPDQLRDLKPSGDAPPGALPQVNGVPFDPNGPSIFTALQEQLGLKLDAQRGPVEVVVIDHVERPTED